MANWPAAVPPVMENREHHRSRDGARLDADIVRYHHTGTATEEQFALDGSGRATLAGGMAAAHSRSPRGAVRSAAGVERAAGEASHSTSSITRA